jgi:hypothetical protein
MRFGGGLGPEECCDVGVNCRETSSFLIPACAAHSTRNRRWFDSTIFREYMKDRFTYDPKKAGPKNPNGAFGEKGRGFVGLALKLDVRKNTKVLKKQTQTVGSDDDDN